MAGFGGVDYTSLTALINHQWQDLGTIQRLATANDVQSEWIVDDGNLKEAPVISKII